MKSKMHRQLNAVKLQCQTIHDCYFVLILKKGSKVGLKPTLAVYLGWAEGRVRDCWVYADVED